ncbi:MAG: histidine phosphatase family protein [Bacteroidales bacterium]|nr:histidine phosphatase family protein [Bacteroidales bacterium]
MAGTKITIVRHGETVWNHTMQLQGHKDSPLTEKGILQAELLSETIKTRKFDTLITSDLGRAIHTAQIINKNLKLSIIIDRNLRERAFGIMEGLTREQICENHQEMYDAYMQRMATFDIPEGESLAVFNNRIMEAFQHIARTYKNKTVLMVAHGGVLDCIIRRIFNLGLDAHRPFSIYNTSVNTITIDSNIWKLEEWGNIEHLQQSAVLNELG